MEALRPESCSSMLLQQQQQLEQFWVQIINGRGCTQNKGRGVGAHLDKCSTT